jgi:hypothetical protein
VASAELTVDEVNDETSIDVRKFRNAAVWRYMDLRKWVDMLQNGSLYMCRADRFEDRFEGSHTARSVDDLKKRGWIGDVFIEWLSYLARVAQWSYVSCWHLSVRESAVLWKAYPHAAVAVRSTIGKLDAVCQDETNWLSQDEREKDGRHFMFGQGLRRVCYIDFKKRHPDVKGDHMAPLCYKRHEFESEREIRAIRQVLPIELVDDPNGGVRLALPPPGPEYALLPVRLSETITAVHVAPGQGKWFDQTRELMERYGLADIPCYRSQLDEDPEFGVLRK